ncbi:MAG: efflux RND transporter periplasmic adaptor subunit [Gemmatimonadales bacterium]|nr:efflux RND transporter periplasmic adaptor subunit [Gemmatimonadales bacterium]
MNTPASITAGRRGLATAATRWKRGAIGAVLLLLAAALFFNFRGTAADDDGRFVAEALSRGKVTARVTATGTLSALVTVQVGSQISGRIQELLADFNTPVKKGQVIGRIDPSLFQAAVERAKANLVAARGNLQKAQADARDADRKLERSRALQAQRVVSKADLDTAQAAAEAAKGQVAAAEGAVAQARAALYEAEVNLGYTTIVSPTDGVVIARNVDVGQTVAASLQAPTLFLIAQDLTKMQVDTSVPEADVGKLHPGMIATFTVDAYPGEPFTGAVRQIRNAPETIDNVVTYDAVLDVANADLRLKPGMTANVTFVVAEREGVLRLPNAALRFRPPRDVARSDDLAPSVPGHRNVWALRGGKPERLEVRTGITDGTFTELVGGPLAEGDRVITDSLEQNSEGGGGRMPMRRIF